MKPNCLHRNPLRTVLVWCLLALWLVGSAQASVHGSLMAAPEYSSAAGETVQHAYHLHHNSDAAETSQSEPHGDAPCFELCLLMTLAPTSPPIALPGPDSQVLGSLVDTPLYLASPATPPPRTALL